MDLRYYNWIMFSKKAGVCEETNKTINVGDKIMFVPHAPSSKIRSGSVYHKDSKYFKENENDILRTADKTIND